MGNKAAGPAKRGSGVWWVAGIAVVITGAMITVSFIQSKKPAAPPIASPAGSAEKKPVAVDRNTKGPVGAKVVLLEYGDYK